MKGIFLTIALAGFLGACAAPPRNQEARNAGSAVAAADILGLCPKHLKVREDQRAYYADRLHEGKRILGNSKGETYYRLAVRLKEPGACEQLSNGNFVANNLFLAKR